VDPIIQSPILVSTFERMKCVNCGAKAGCETCCPVCGKNVARIMSNEEFARGKKQSLSCHIYEKDPRQELAEIRELFAAECTCGWCKRCQSK